MLQSWNFALVRSYFRAAPPHCESPYLANRGKVANLLSGQILPFASHHVEHAFDLCSAGSELMRFSDQLRVILLANQSNFKPWAIFAKYPISTRSYSVTVIFARYCPC